MTKFLMPLMLASFSLANAELITVECSDGNAQYEDAILRTSKCNRITQADALYFNNLPKTISLKSIDQRSLGLFIKLSKLDDAAVFAFIDSLDEQAFRVIYLYSEMLQAKQITDLLKFKMLINQKFQAITDTKNERISEFINERLWAAPKDGFGSYETLSKKYLGRELSYQNYYNQNGIDSLKSLLVLIHFYQETLKKPLPINTDHLKAVYHAQDSDIKNELLKKKLVILQ